MLTLLIDANIIMMTSRIWEARAKVTNNIVMERSVMLTMIVLMHIQNIGEARAKVTNIIVAC